MVKLCNDLLNHISIKSICWYVNIFDLNTVTGDFIKTVYISNYPREASTKQSLSAREHTMM